MSRPASFTLPLDTAMQIIKALRGKCCSVAIDKTEHAQWHKDLANELLDSLRD